MAENMRRMQGTYEFFAAKPVSRPVSNTIFLFYLHFSPYRLATFWIQLTRSGLFKLQPI